MFEAQLRFRTPKFALRPTKINLRTCGLQRNMPTFAGIRDAKWIWYRGSTCRRRERDDRVGMICHIGR